jgi:hypothetical protein
MKKDIIYQRLIVFLLFIWSFPGASAQSTSHFNYQAIISNSDGTPFNGTAGIKISILQPAEDGEVVYSERHTKETDENGLVSFRVGESDQVYAGKFDSINWSAGPSYIRTEIAPGGGFSYSISTITELVSVPMAMFAWKADSIASGFMESDPIFSASPASFISIEDTVKWNSLSKKAKYQVGDLFGGGIIFHVEPDGEHGLIASLADIGDEVSWGTSGLIINAGSFYDGNSNTESIVGILGSGSFAAYVCDTLNMNGFDDWYLPSADEMYLLLKSRYILNRLFEEDETEEMTVLGPGSYWTSTEEGTDQAIQFKTGNMSLSGKEEAGKVRAVRAF